MKQFLYLDHDIVNSIIAQADKGFITEYSQETENGEDIKSNKQLEGAVNGEAGWSLLKLAKAVAKLELHGTLGSEKSVSSSSRELVTKTLHDAAFDMAYDRIRPVVLNSEKQESDYGVYIELRRVFDVVDFDYLEDIFANGGLIELIKKSEKEKLETGANGIISTMNRDKSRAAGNQVKAEIKKASAEIDKKYADFQEVIGAIRKLMPYKRMLISHDGYLIPLEDDYFRIDPQSLGFKYGGEITCVGMITNIIGEDTNPNDSRNIFATLQFTVNEALRSILPTIEKNLCVVHPIAVYYGD